MMTFFHGIDVPLVPWRTQSLVPMALVPMALVHLAYGAPNPGALGALAHTVPGAPGPW